jgi:hypothetical protein
MQAYNGLAMQGIILAACTSPAHFSKHTPVRTCKCIANDGRIGNGGHECALVAFA